MMLSTAMLDAPTGYKYILLDPQSEDGFMRISAPTTASKDSIYVIMVCERMEVKNFFPDLGSRRLVGWYAAYETAVSAVTENWGDLYEYAYRYALIERVKEGLYRPADSHDRWWFEYDYETGGYVPIKEPEEFSGYSGFTIG